MEFNNMVKKVTMSGRKIEQKAYSYSQILTLERKNIFWFILYIILYIMIGIQLGVMPLGEMMTNGLMYPVIGQSDISHLSSIFDLSYSHLWIPYGMRITEGFGIYFLIRLVALTGLSGLHVIQLIAFLFYSMGYMCMLNVMNKISGNKIYGLVLTIIYFYNPIMMSQQGVPPLYFGVLFIPVVILQMYYFNQYIGLQLKKEKYLVTLKRLDIYYILINFLVYFVLASTSWYLAIIAACAICLYYLLYLLFYLKKVPFYKLIFKYFEYVLIPWFAALGINLLMTPSSVADTTTAFNFINGSSIDVITMLLPNSLQFIGRFFNVEDVVSDGRYIPGNGVRFYFGYSIIILIILSIILKKVRNKVNISILFTGIVLLILSLGPGLRFAAILDVEMQTQLGPHRLPLEEDVFLFPWGFLFEKFPLTIMRAVYRWYIGAIALFIVLAARVLGFMAAAGKRSKIIAYIICICMLIEFLPNMDNLVGEKIYNYNTYMQAYEDCVEELEGVLEGEENRLAFCAYDYNSNTYMLPLIMSGLENCEAYLGSGDKARGMARPYWPQAVSGFMFETNPDILAMNITKMAAFNLAEYAIFPYYDLSNAIYSWPMSDEIVDRTKNIAERTAEILENRYDIIRLEHYMIIKLKDENASESIDILANKNSDHAKYFLTDDGFGTKYAIEITDMKYEKTVLDEDNALYIYCVSKAENDGTSELHFEFRDDNGKLIDTDSYLIVQKENYILTELQIPLPDHTKSVECYFTNADTVMTYLKKISLVAYNEESILNSDIQSQIEHLLGMNTETIENVEIDGDEMIINDDTNILIKDNAEKVEGKHVKIKFELLLENDEENIENVEIINKWRGWLDEMTFAFSLHRDERVYYLSLSDDGKNPKVIGWSEENMPRNQWNALEINFEEGNVVISVNGKCIHEEQCEFKTLYVSNRPVKIGNGMIGKIKNFEYEID